MFVGQFRLKPQKGIFWGQVHCFRLCPTKFDHLGLIPKIFLQKLSNMNLLVDLQLSFLQGT